MTLLEEARELIKKHLATNEQTTIAGMARAADIPIPTARSIIQGEVKDTSVDNITALLLTFMSFGEVLSLVNKHNGSKRFWSGILKLCESRDAKNMAGTKFDYRYPDHKIIASASSQFGITRDMIYQTYGHELGGKRLEALLSAGIIKEVDGTIFQQAQYVHYSLTVARKRVELQANEWDESEIENGGFLYHLHQNLSDEGHETGREITRKYIEDMTELEKKYPGGKKVLMLSILANILKG